MFGPGTLALTGRDRRADSYRMSSLVGHGRAPDGLRLGRYLPLSVAVTLSVIALPLLAVAQLGPARNALTLALHVLIAVALSVAVARLLALAWTRHPYSTDLVFSDLLVWGWARRVWAEHRLEQLARDLGDPGADVEARGRMLQRLSALLEARDPYTHGHSRRVARHAERIASGMGLPREQVAAIRTAALVHDLGKINVPRSVLTKPARLTDAEFDLIKRHPGDGAALVAKLGDPELAACVRHHHERLDGKGYPDGLAGQDIPIGARIIAVADTFDAITSPRAYRGARPHKVALDIVRREAGSQLDPDAVEAFLGYYTSRRSVGWATVLIAAPQRLLSGLGGVQSGLAIGAAPIAQTACGVGAAALIGACLAGPVATDSASDPTPRADHVVVQARAAAPVPPSSGEMPPGARVDHGVSQQPERRRHVDERSPSSGPGDDAPRALDVPTDGGPGGGSQPAPGGQPSGGDSGGVDIPAVEEVPVTVPDPGDVTGPVNDVLPPQVQPPSLPLPNVDVPLPSVQVPGLGQP